MTYTSGYKFGHKTKSEIDALATAGLEVGDNVYNTDINKEEHWTGDVWTNADCVVLTCDVVAGLSVGNIVDIVTDNLKPNSVELSTIDNRWAGVIYRGGAQNTEVVVAVMGMYEALMDPAFTNFPERQHIAIISTTAGTIDSTNLKTGGAGAVGAFAEDWNGTITAVADAGGGDIIVTGNNRFEVGDTVDINGTTNYNGTYTITGATGTTFNVTATFVATNTGTFVGLRASKLVKIWLSGEAF